MEKGAGGVRRRVDQMEERRGCPIECHRDVRESGGGKAHGLVEVPKPFPKTLTIVPGVVVPGALKEALFSM